MIGRSDDVMAPRMRGGRLRALAAGFRRWPLHPQWLLDPKNETRELAQTLLRFEGTILDIGCADRRLAGLVGPGCRYLGLDYPATAVSMYGTRPDVFADARRLPFGDASIDSVILKDVLEHIRGPRAALSEIARILRPGGRLLLWMPFLYPVHDAPHDFQRFTEHGLLAYLEEEGFEIEEMKPVLGGFGTAALLANLAFADSCEQIAAHSKVLSPLIPLFCLMILLCNLAGRALSSLPGTGFMPAFYRLVAVRIGERR